MRAPSSSSSFPINRATNKSLCIAVADDEQDIREYLQKVLHRMGHTVLQPVSTGLELVAVCATYQPDLVITDLRMPDMAGDEALRKICEQRPVPFIVISALGDRLPADGFPHQACKCLNKPIKQQDLQLAIAEVWCGGGDSPKGDGRIE